MHKHQAIIDKLFALHLSKGFLREEEALFEMAENDVSIQDIDRILEVLLEMGVVFVDESTDDDDEYDKAQIDYELIFTEILSASPGLELFISCVREFRPPQHREWRVLIPQAHNGNVYARNRLFEMYLRVVVRLALKFHKTTGFELDDAIQEGSLGLLRAIEVFDPAENGTFAAYFPLWVQQYIGRAIADKGRTIRLPVHMFETVRKIHRIGNDFFNNHGIEANDNDLAEIAEMSVKEVRQIKVYSQIPCSMEELIIVGDDDFLEYDILIDRSLTPIEVAEINDKKNFLKREIRKLKPREIHVIELRYGFRDRQNKTLEEVGKMLGLTRERIRQIENKALRKLRTNQKILILL